MIPNITGAFELDRSVYAKVQVGNTNLIQRQDIIKMSVEESCADQNIAIGTTNSQVLKVQFHKGNYVIQGATFKPYISFDETTWIPLGVFNATDCVNDYEDVYTVTAYDQMAFLDEEYETTLTFPTTVSAIVQDICTQKGLTFEGTLTSITISTLYEGSIRETLGYMAGLYGKNAIINRDGKLEFIWYTRVPSSPSSAICGTAILGSAVVGNAGDDITQYAIYEDEIKINGSVTITALISGGETAIESGSGRAITFYNPYMTQAILDGLRASMLPFVYNGVEVRYRGNPAYELGDIVAVDGYTTPIMRHYLEYDGGMSGTIYSYGLSDEKSIVAQMSPTEKEVNRQVNPIRQQVEEMNEDIIAGRNGYVVDVISESGGTKYRSAIRAMNTPEITSTTKGLEINSNGIAWSENGYQSYSKTILDMANGKMYADNISSNSILTNTFQIGNVGGNASMSFNGTTGAITFGNNVSVGWSNLPNDVASDTDAYNYGVSGATNYCSTQGFLNSTTGVQKTTRIGASSLITESLEASNLYLSGGRININTSSETDDLIQLNGNNFVSSQMPHGFNVSHNTNSNTFLSDGILTTDGTHTTTIEADQITCENIIPRENNTYLLGNPTTYWNGVVATNFMVKTATTTSSAYCGFTPSGYLQKYVSSSMKYKKNIKVIPNELKDKFKKLYDIEVKSWKYKKGYVGEEDELYEKETFGIIAEDLNEILPEAVVHDNEGNVENYRDRHLINAMLFLIQEQHKEIEQLKNDISELKARLE